MQDMDIDADDESSSPRRTTPTRSTAHSNGGLAGGSVDFSLDSSTLNDETITASSSAPAALSPLAGASNNEGGTADQALTSTQRLLKERAKNYKLKVKRPTTADE